MPKTWVVVAESSRARLFLAEKPLGPLQELEDLTHPESRLHDQELTSDLPGRAFDSAGQGRHAMEQRQSPKQHEAAVFAREIAQRLETARTAGEFDRLVIAAPPAFLGLLREHLSSETQKHVSEEIPKHLVTLDARALREHLPERL